MKFSGKWFIILLFVFILAMNIVCAGDNVTSYDNCSCEDSVILDNDMSAFNESLSVSDDDLLGDAGSFSDLANVISNGGSSVKLTKDYQMKTGDNPITISKNGIVIDGQGHTIDANSINKVFIVSGSNVVLKDITFSNSNSINGGAIRWTGASGKLLDSSFINCKSPFWKGGTTGEAGGGVSWTGANGLMDNCYFKGCTAQGGAGGSIHWSGNNGVINNTEIVDTIMYNCNYGYGSNNGAYAICWKGTGGKLLNTKITNPQKTGYNKRPYVVDFVNGQCWIDGLTITGETDGYSIFLPKTPVEDFIGSINVNMAMYKYTPTITLNNDVCTIKNVKSGTATYQIDGKYTGTANVNKNGQFTLNYKFNPQQTHIIKITYNENQYYNSVSNCFDYNKMGVSNVFGSFTDLKNLITSSTDSVINLYSNYIYDSVKDSALAGGITISKALTINGHGHYIDADYNQVRIFTTTAQVVLNNITFKNSRLNSPGNAVLAKSTINITYCTFDNNWASDCFGAALKLSGDNSNVKYCNFTNNKAKTGAAIVVNSLNNYIQYSYFEGNSKDYGGNMNYGSDISITGGKSAYVNYNAFLDARPLRQISNAYSRSNWYGINALPDSSAPGAPGISNYLKVELDYTLKNNVLTVGIKFSESDTGNTVSVPWSRTVTYTLASNTIIGDNLNKVSFKGVSGSYVINAIIDNQRLTNTNGNTWYVKATATSTGSGTQSNPYKTLKNAINSASNGDTIYIAPGTYTGSGSNVALTISKSLTLERWGSSGEVVFDGENKYTIFTLSSNVIISSLTFKNAKGSSGGALIIKSNSVIFNSIFKDCTASSWGGAIDMNPGSATIVKSQFINNKASSGGGAISTAGVTLNIINSVFTNNNGGRGGAINSGNTAADLYIIGSVFNKNTATSYGGALIFDGTGNIYNSQFTDNSALLGGGAVYMWGYTHIIENTIFTNNLGCDGGAILSLCSNLILSNNYFNNNYADSGFGGAVYDAFGDLIIFKNTLTGNGAYYDGGGVYLYKSSNTIFETLFKSNIAGYGGGAIHALASDFLSIRLLMLNNISSALNGYINTKYLNSFIDCGDYNLIVADTSNYKGTLPAYFSLTANGWDTKVKNQGSLGICWDYATIAMVETAIKKATGIEMDLSEGNLKNLLSKYSEYGKNRNPNDGGYRYDGASCLANSLGPVLESIDPTSSYGFSVLLDNIVHVSNIGIVSRSKSNPLDNDKVKEAIIKYGAVKASIGMTSARANGYNYYDGSSAATNHAVAIVGWDDNYSKNNFKNNCPGDGAWIVKNSWGPNSGKNGYIYVSYYDASFAWGDLYYIIFNDTIQYDRVYQYDYATYSMRSTGGSVSWYKNTYTSVKNEGITAFSTHFNAKTNWEVYVYVNNKLVHTQTGSSMSAGYFTFNLNKIIPVAKGDEFTIALKVNNANFPYVTKTLNTVPCGAGRSYYSKDGVTWTDLNSDNQVASLKAFTQNMPGSLVTISPITNVTYNNPVTVNFNIENRTTVNYILKSKNGEIIKQIQSFTGNKITLSGLSAGDYTITIINTNSNKYVGNSQSLDFTVFKADTSVTIKNIASVIYNNNVNVDYTIVNPTVVTYIVKSSTGIVVVPNTTATDLNKITLPVLNAGTYTITIANSENVNYKSSIASSSFTITKATPTITITASNTVYPNKLSVGVKSNVAGSYTVKVASQSKTVNLEANKESTVAFPLDADTYNVIVEYGETENYKAATKNTNVQISKASSSVNINNIATVNYGSKVNINYNVVNPTVVTYIVKTSTGVVAVQKTTVNDLNKITLPVLNAGQYTITINNDENKNYKASTASSSFTVTKATPTITITASNTVYPNKLNVGVKSNVAGNYLVKVADQSKIINLVANKESIIVFNKTLNPNTYNILVESNETVNYTAASKNFNVQISKASSSVNINNIASVNYGGNVNVNYNVVNPTQVTYTVKNTNGDIIIQNTIANDLNKITLPVLNAGDYIITILNKENVNYKSSSASSRFTINKVTPVIGISVSNVGYPNNLIVGVTSNVAGNYIVKTGDKVKTITLTANKQSNVVFEGLNAGAYNVLVEYGETFNYAATSKNAGVQISKASSSVNINNIASVNYGGNVNVNYNVVNPTQVTYTVKNTNGDIIIQNTIANDLNKITLPVLNAGDYIITILNKENVNYKSSSASSRFTINKVTPVIGISVSNVGYPNNLIVGVTSNVAGNYIVKTGDKVKTITLTANKHSNVVFEGLNAGAYNVIVEYGETANYKAALKNIGAQIVKAESNVNIINIKSVTSLDKVNIDYNVINPTSVTYTVKSVTGEIIIPNALVKSLNKITLPVLDAGDYIITIVNSENNNIKTSNVSSGFKISKVTPTITVNVSNVIYPNKLIVSVKSDVTGNYNVKVANQNRIVNLTANKSSEVVFDVIGAGTYNVIVKYDENRIYNSNTVNTSVEIFKANSNVKITDTISGVYKTKKPVINVIFENKTVLKYTIYKNNMIISSGDYNQLNNALNMLNVGKYNITISNIGDSNYNPSNDSKAFQILKANSKVNINKINPATYNNTLTITYTVDNKTSITYTLKTASGKVIIENKTTNKDILEFSNLAAGNYIITIMNAENDSYTCDIKSAEFTINKAENNVEIMAEDKILPGDVTIKVKADIDGDYNINMGDYNVNVKVISGEGYASISLPEGSNYTTSTIFDDTQNYTINCMEAKFNVVKGVNNIKIETQSVTYPDIVTVKLTADIPGEYIIDINGTEIPVIIKENNHAASTTIQLTPGNYVAKIINYASEVYEAKTDINNFTVSKGLNIVNVFVEDIDYGESAIVYLTASVKGNYTVNINGTELTVEVLNDGSTGYITSAEFTRAGKYYANVTSRLQYYDEIFNNTIFTVSNIDNNISIDVSVEDSILINILMSKPVRSTLNINVDGKKYPVEVVEGKINYTITNLKTGLHNITLSYLNDDNLTINSKPVNFTVINEDIVDSEDTCENTTVFKFLKTNKYTFKNSKKIKTVKVSLQTTSGVKLANMKIIFKFSKKSLKKIKAKNRNALKLLKQLKNGYMIKTNHKGLASIKLMNKYFTFKKGKYTFTVTFNGNNIYNTISKTGKIIIK